MIREIIKPTTNSYNIIIPDEYINTEIEILVLPFSLNSKEKIGQNLKSLLANVTEGLTESDLVRQKDFGRGASNWLS